MRKLLMMAAVIPMLTACGVYSDGERTGVVNKLSNKGLLCKTWEGEMLLGGLKTKKSTNTDSDGHTSTSTSVVANIFEFSVTDETVVNKIKTAQRSAEVVTLTYGEFILPDICGRATSYVITDVITD